MAFSFSSFGVISCLLLLVQYSHSYDTTDLEIFDLVEEIGQQQSFYDLLQIPQVKFTVNAIDFQ